MNGEWWGTKTPYMKEIDVTSMEFNYYEAECATHGSEWEVIHDSGASGDEYITAQKGLNSTDAIKTADESTIRLQVKVNKTGTYYIFARLNCANSSDDSFYMKIDDDDFVTFNNMQTSGWAWKKLYKTELSAGEHRVTFSYREDGAKLDKLCITDYYKGPTDQMDVDKALNDCR